MSFGAQTQLAARVTDTYCSEGKTNCERSGVSGGAGFFVLECSIRSPASRAARENVHPFLVLAEHEPLAVKSSLLQSLSGSGVERNVVVYDVNHAAMLALLKCSPSIL